MNFANLWGLFPQPQNLYAREQRLTRAYNNVFRGNPSKEDQDLVLVDLAYHSGFSMVSPSDVSDAELRTREGKRALFALIRSKLTLTPRDIDALDNAARREAMMSFTTQT